jgi:hypothetical protein
MRFHGSKFWLTGFTVCVFVLSAGSILAQQHRSEVSFSQAELSFERVSGYDAITLPGTHLMNQLGEPALPVRNVYVALPGDVRVTGVRLASFEAQEISGKYNVYPAQPPVPLIKGAKPGPFIAPKASIYSSPDPYPTDLVTYVGTGSLGGQKIAMLQVHPVQYVPSEEALRFYERIEFDLVTEPDQGSKGTVVCSHRAQVSLDKISQGLVTNPQDVGQDIDFAVPSGDHLEYLIITDDELASAFEPLAQWKTEKGIPAAIRTTSWISSNYSGSDLQEKIRNYLKAAYQDSGTVWVLLGGDTEIVPCRYVRIDLETLSEDIPADLYYSDLDGDWNYDGDSRYGEPEDSLDMFPDVIVGRAPVSDVQQAERFVDKVFTYGRTPALDYQLNSLFFAEYADAVTDDAIAKDMIIDRYVPDRFDPVSRLYESLGNLSAGAVVDSLNLGVNIANHCGHAYYYILSTGSSGLYNSDFDGLTNGPRYTGVLYSVGCWPAAIDYDCIAEHFVNSPNGGGFFVGNSRYGWYSPSFPGYSSSDLFDQAFFSEVFLKSNPRLGAALAASKLQYAADAQAVNEYRWICFCLILLGDPEMALWTDQPGTLAAHYPDTIVVGESEFLVTVTDGGQPVEDALVCVLKGDEVYEVGSSGADGQVWLAISPASAGSLSVTVTAQNFLPHQGQVVIVSGRPHITQYGYVIDDVSGNDDGIVNPGETIGLSLTLKNFGDQTAYGVVCSLFSSSSLVEAIPDGEDNYGDLTPGNSASGEFSFQVSSTASDRDVIYFDLQVTADGGFQWDLRLAITVGTPVPVYLRSHLVDWPNGDGFADPSDSVSLEVAIKNQGLGNAVGVYGILSTDDDYIDIVSDSSWFGDLAPGDSASSQTAYELTVSESCPNGHNAWLSLTLVGEAHSSVDSFVLLVGGPGFFDDVEDGEGGWVHSGTTDEWHITEHRSYSEGHSWYCGNEGTWEYSNDFTAYLVSPYVLITEDAELSFWTWHYIESGWDFAFCEINRGEGWIELAMMTGQSGGWVEKIYDLSEYAGDSVQIRFTFFSDDDAGQFEGWYVDDIQITPRKPDYLCGDCNHDWLVDVADVLYLINYLFTGGSEPIPPESGDVDTNSLIDIADVMYLINYLFIGGPRPCMP